MALVALQPVIRLMDESDPETMSAAFTVLGWYKPPALYQRYLAEQEEGRRLAFLAEWRGEFAGYVTLLWVSDYRPFAERQIPEISDLNVLPPHRRHGIGNALLDRAESAASARSKVVGLGVGLYSDYGAAQRIYVRRGYLPDGRGIMYRNQPVEPGATIRIDDDAALMLTRPVGLRSPPGHPRGAHRVRQWVTRSRRGEGRHHRAPTIRAEPGDLRSMRSLSGASARQKIFGDQVLGDRAFGSRSAVTAGPRPAREYRLYLSRRARPDQLEYQGQRGPGGVAAAGDGVGPQDHLRLA